MKRILTMLLVMSASTFSMASTLTPIGTDVEQFKAHATCQVVSQNKEQCDLKDKYINTNFKNLIPSSAQLISTNNISNIEALMFKDSEYDNILKLLKAKLGDGKNNITNTAVSWNINGWTYTLSKNPNKEVALIGMLFNK